MSATLQFIPLPCLGVQIGKYPVTIDEYEEFRPGHRAKIAKRRYGATFARPHHPVIHVTWHDAMAYCAWLGQRLGAEVRLPTDAEWAAAWGPHVYPWGDEFDKAKCNTRESGIGHTTPVDRYPEGASPCGVLDLAGNVWEWGAEGEDDCARRLRGGAWLYSASFARSAFRHDTPDYAHLFVGFRCVAVPHAPEPAVPCVPDAEGLADPARSIACMLAKFDDEDRAAFNFLIASRG